MVKGEEFLIITSQASFTPVHTYKMDTAQEIGLTPLPILVCIQNRTHVDSYWVFPEVVP